MRTTTQSTSTLLLLRALLQHCHQQLFLVPRALPLHSSTTPPIPCFFSLCIHLPTSILSGWAHKSHQSIKKVLLIMLHEWTVWYGNGHFLNVCDICIHIWNYVVRKLHNAWWSYTVPLCISILTLFFAIHLSISLQESLQFQFLPIIGCKLWQLHPASPI